MTYYILIHEKHLHVGGLVIQNECDQYVKMNGPVMEGQSIVTEAGKLPCKKIIHAVGPHWNGGNDGEADILYDCVCNYVMQTAIEQNVKTIAIPTISAGIFGFPIVVSTSTIVEALKDFLNAGTYQGNLSEIHLFDNNTQGGEAFVSALKKYFEVTPPKRQVVKQSSIKKRGN